MPAAPDFPPAPDRVAPKYDPETGELVRPLEFRPDAERPTAPIPVANAPSAP